MKHIKNLAVVMVIAILSLVTLTACGGKKTYTYESASLYLGDVEVGADSDEVKLMNEMYAGGTLEFDGKTAVITFGEGEDIITETMEATKEGDEYVLKNDGATAEGAKITLKKTEKGYDLTNDMGGEYGKVVMHFVK